MNIVEEEDKEFILVMSLLACTAVSLLGLTGLYLSLLNHIAAVYSEVYAWGLTFVLFGLVSVAILAYINNFFGWGGDESDEW